MANLTLLPEVVKYFVHQREKFPVEIDFDAETATPPQRLEHFIGARYGGWGSKGRFAEAAGMPVEQLSQYLPAVKPGREKAMRMPGGDVLLRFQQAGMSIDWWASGKGGMDAPESMAKSRSLADQSGCLDSSTSSSTYAP